MHHLKNAYKVNEFLTKKQICVTDYHPYSPDLSPCDYSPYPKLKTAIKGAFYDDVPTIQSAVTQVLENIQKPEFKKSMHELVARSKRELSLWKVWKRSFFRRKNVQNVVFSLLEPILNK